MSIERLVHAELDPCVCEVQHKLASAIRNLVLNGIVHSQTGQNFLSPRLNIFAVALLEVDFCLIERALTRVWSPSHELLGGNSNCPRAQADD